MGANQGDLLPGKPGDVGVTAHDDRRFVAADWFLDLWNQAPTSGKAAPLRETTIERFLKAHRLRRWRAPEVLQILKKKPLAMAPGVVEPASDHILTLAARLRLINQQLKVARYKLDELCDQLVPSEGNAPGQCYEQRNVMILRTMPGLGRINLAALLPTGVDTATAAPCAPSPTATDRLLSGACPLLEGQTLFDPGCQAREAA
jgi:hypothetical protein